MDEERLRKLTKDVKIYLSETNPPWFDVPRTIIEYLHENKLLREASQMDTYLKDPIIKCEKHGEHCNTMETVIDGKPIGLYCFYCYNEFLEKNIKNFKKKGGDSNEEKEKGQSETVA